MVEFSDLFAEEAQRARRGPVRDDEHRLQCMCVRYFHYKYPAYRGLLFAVPNGGARSKATAGRLKAEGVVAGVSDLLFLVPRGKYHGLCLETKTPKGRQSPEQKEWQKKVEAQGYLYKIYRNFDEFRTILDKFLNEN